MKNKKRRGRARHHRGDFWQDWHTRREHIWEEQDRQGKHSDHGKHGKRPFPPRQRARFWREFFHEYMGIWPEDHWAFGGRRFSPWHQGRDQFNPFVSTMLSKGGGLLPLYVMQLLSQKPHYGNELMERITERTNGQWVANPGAIYPLMAVLEKQGLIIGEWEDPQKRTVRIYRLTAVGEKEINRLKAIITPKLEEAIKVMQVIANDLNDGDEISE